MSFKMVRDTFIITDNGTDESHPGQLQNDITECDAFLEKEPLSWMFWKKRRYIVAVLLFFGTFNVYALRGNLSVAVVAMTENRTVHYENGTIGHEQYFNWSTTERGLILSSFFYGYILTQFIGGYFGAIIGGNVIFGFGIFVTAVLTILTPWVANFGCAALMTIRIIEGIFEGIVCPCIFTVLSRWAPPKERSRMLNLAFAGSHAGTVVAMPVCGLLAESFGWESLFYFFGAVGVIWYIVWVSVVKDGPEKDRYITDDELLYIQKSLGKTSHEKLSHPWADIFTSKPFYAICLSHFAENWGFYTMLTQLPSFLKDCMGYQLSQSGLLSGAPYLAMGTLSGFSSYTADILQIKGYLTTTQVRRYFNCGGFFVQTLFLLLAAFLLHPIGSILAIIFGVGCGAFVMTGYSVNFLDIAPDYSGTLYGISNTFATIPGIICPTLTGYLVQNNTAEEWRMVFYITAVIYLVGIVTYWCWASGELQPWAKKPIDCNENKENNARKNNSSSM